MTGKPFGVEARTEPSRFAPTHLLIQACQQPLVSGFKSCPQKLSRQGDFRLRPARG